jgi:hypothetical protein
VSHIFERSEFDNDTLYLDVRDLEKRARAKKALALCLPNQPRTAVFPQTYSGYKTIAGLANKGWIHIAQPLICGAIGLTVSNTQPRGEKFVTEHVLEKQTLQDAIELMAKGVLPAGGRLSQGAAAVQGVFDQAGVGDLSKSRYVSTR